MRANRLGLRDVWTLCKGSCRLRNPSSLHTSPVTLHYYNTFWIHSSPGFKPVIWSILKVFKTIQWPQIYCRGLQVLMSHTTQRTEQRSQKEYVAPGAQCHWWRITETNEDRPTCWTLHSRMICVGCTELNRGQETIYIYLKCSNPKEMSAFYVTNGDETLDR
jgi:hypothetical protein